MVKNYLYGEIEQTIEITKHKKHKKQIDDEITEKAAKFIVRKT